MLCCAIKFEQANIRVEKSAKRFYVKQSKLENRCLKADYFSKFLLNTCK